MTVLQWHPCLIQLMLIHAQSIDFERELVLGWVTILGVEVSVKLHTLEPRSAQSHAYLSGVKGKVPPVTSVRRSIFREESKTKKEKIWWREPRYPSRTVLGKSIKITYMSLTPRFRRRSYGCRVLPDTTHCRKHRINSVYLVDSWHWYQTKTKA